MKTSSSPSLLVEANQLITKNLLDLINGEILALRIYPFVSVEQCMHWQQKIEHSRQLSRYSNAQDVPVNRIGMTLFETENKPGKIDTYLSEGQKTLPLMRQLFGANNPLQLLFTGLKKSWQNGVQIAQLNGQTMNPGIIRSFEACGSGGLPPHVDSLLKDLPDTTAFDQLECQIAANLYFSLPEDGGELEVWDFEPCVEKLAELYNGNYDFLDTSKIPKQPERLQPKIGELILFRSNCVHAVRASKGGMRSAASCFIGYCGIENPLIVWA